MIVLPDGKMGFSCFENVLKMYCCSYFERIFFSFQSLESTRRMIALCEEVSFDALHICDLFNLNNTLYTAQL